jgi:cyanate lyase
MASTLRQQARKKVNESAAQRRRAWAEREEALGKAAVDVVAAIAARDRADQNAAEAVGAMLGLEVTLAEVGERCGLALKEVTRLRRTHLDTRGRRPGGTRKSASAAAGVSAR